MTDYRMRTDCGPCCRARTHGCVDSGEGFSKCPLVRWERAAADYLRRAKQDHDLGLVPYGRAVNRCIGNQGLPRGFRDEVKRQVGR